MAISSVSSLMAPGSPGDPTSSPMGLPSEVMPISGGNNMGGGTAKSGLATIDQGSQVVGQALNQASQAIGFKKGGKVSSKGRDWHGFGGSKTGNNNHGF